MTPRRARHDVEHRQDMLANYPADGAYGPAKTMARAIITSQTTEITQMNRLLGKS